MGSIINRHNIQLQQTASLFPTKRKCFTPTFAPNKCNNMMEDGEFQNHGRQYQYHLQKRKVPIAGSKLRKRKHTKRTRLLVFLLVGTNKRKEPRQQTIVDHSMWYQRVKKRWKIVSFDIQLIFIECRI